MRTENRNSNLIKIMKAISVFLLVLFLANTILCMVYTSVEAGHHCDHEDCPICEMILICEKTVRELCGFTAVVIIAYSFAGFVDFISKKGKSLLIRLTLVNQGIRLND
ncbi:MAG: hypothetical protein IJT72_04115 [Lachnospiraceae bacterium]|nr:hypothetical protein [Lachnospiraceae bacterium]